jgi:hypothetical protein
MADIMKMGKNPNYLGAWDLEEIPGREVTLTIAQIVDEKVPTNGKTELCTVCYWTDRNFKPMILNITNKKMLCRLYKTKETDKLSGKAVTIGIEKVKAFGDIHDALRILKRIPTVAEAVKCSDCGSDIQGAMGKGADYIAQYTHKKFGVPLCFHCAENRTKAKETPTQAEGAVADGKTETDG